MTMQPTGSSKHSPAWFAYGAATVIFIALATYILALRPGRDSRIFIWGFIIGYPVLTLPVLITYLRVRELRLSRRQMDPGHSEAGMATLLPVFLVGLLPSMMLAGGRFLLRFPNSPPPTEFGLFLAMFATLLIFVMLARFLTRVLVDEQGVAGLGKVEEPAALRRLRGSYFILATGLFCTSMTMFSPLFAARGFGGIAIVGGMLAMVYVGTLLLVKAVRRRGHVAVLMAALFMSVYLAVAVTYWYLFKRWYLLL